MLKIGAEQYAAIGERSFAARMDTLLRRHFPKETAGLERGALDAEVLRQAVVAGRYGLQSEQGVATFILSAWLLGPGFDARIPAITERLADSQLAEAEKAAWLEAFSSALLHALSR